MSGHDSSQTTASFLSSANSGGAAGCGTRDQDRQAHPSLLSADNIGARDGIEQAGPLTQPGEMRGAIE